MASVCGGCLAFQDAGVLVKCSIAGIAMGLVLDTKEFGGDGTPLILFDIIGSEDASGDMDFKVVRITLPIMKQALLQAKKMAESTFLVKYISTIIYDQHSWGQPCVDRPKLAPRVRRELGS
ncbi:hypothetical protein ACSBR1_035920 [Camellia fascicularis]